MDLRKQANRVRLIEMMSSAEEKKRRDESFICSEVYNGRLRQYVIEYLQTLFHRDTVQEMPIQSGANIVKKIVEHRATIYNDKVRRNFEDASDEQIEVLEKIYKETDVSYLMGIANEFYVLNNQVLVQIIPKNGKFKMKVLKLHHFGVITMKDDPTEMLGVVISSYDKKFKRDDKGNFNPLGTGAVSNPYKGNTPDGIDQPIADDDDSGPTTFEVWTRSYYDEELDEEVPALQFICDKDGVPLSDDLISPIDILPFVNICGYQDHQFFAENSKSLTDFTIEYNAFQSELAQMFRMSSYSQAVLSGPESLLPRDNELTVGPNRTLVLKKDVDLGDVTFDYVSPNGQINNGIEYLEMLLAQFLSCNGIDPKVISKESGQTYSSGIERLLAMIERFQATRADYVVMEKAEKEILKIFKAYLEAYSGTDVLVNEYSMAPLSEYCSVSVQYSKPEGAQTMREKLETQEKLMSLGLANRVTAIKELYGFDQVEAEEFIEKIDLEKNKNLQMLAVSQNNNNDGNGDNLEYIKKENQNNDVKDNDVIKDETLGAGQGNIEVQKDSVLNGAQVTSMINVVNKVAMGELPRSSGLSILISAFGLTEERALEIMGDAGLGFKVTKE